MFLTKEITDNGIRWTAYASATNSRGQYNVRLAKLAYEEDLIPQCAIDGNGFLMTVYANNEQEATQIAKAFQTTVTGIMDDLYLAMSVQKVLARYDTKEGLDG